jgi:hypothetical protein
MSYSHSKCMIELDPWVEFECPIFWESSHLNMAISPMKIKLCSRGIVCSTLIFIFKDKCFRFRLYSTTEYFCKHSV